jgi:tetratricopeptide (TPR) repeat protein
VVTSRNRLTSLVAADDARPVTLDLLTTDEARDLLAARLGGARVVAEPAAVDEIVALCARLPLALAVAAGRAVTDPHSTLARLASELGGDRDRLDTLDGGDPATQVRAVFSWSYQRLRSDAARLFRLLGVHCGPDISVPAAASLSGVTVAQLRPALAELTRACLLTEHRPGRFALHDLLRAYAADLADTDPDRQPALRRMLDHYLHTASAAALQLDPQRDQLPLVASEPGVSTEDITDPTQAMAWYTAEHRVLLAALRCADASRLDAHVWGLAWTATDFLDRRGYWQERIDVNRAGLDAAVRAGDLLIQARCQRWLANGLIMVGDLDAATVHLGQALGLSRDVGDHLAQAHTYTKLALVLERQGRHREALGHIDRALELYLAAGDLGGQARALNDLGWLHSHLGNHRLALTSCEQAVELLKQLGNRAEQADTWDSLGYIHRQLGDPARSAECYRRAIELYQQTGDRYNEADTFNSLGAMHEATGDSAAARAAWRQALDLFTQIGHANADEVRAHLGTAVN